MLVQGITRSNYDTVGAQRLANAENQLQSAVQSGASDKVLLKLQKTVDDLKNSIAVREKERERYLDKMTLTERRVRESQFDDIKSKFDESNERAEASAERSREAVRAVSEKVGGALDTVFDSVAHTLLGPLNLIVNPLEQALGFNLFKVAKKPVADFIEGKFPATYDKLKNNGGLIGAVGVAIIDAIHGGSGSGGDGSGGVSGYLTGDGSLDITSLLSGSGMSFAAILKGAGIVGLVAAAIAGIIAGWKGEWDKNGAEESADLKALLQDESATAWDKIKGVAIYAVHSVFGVVVGGLRSGWESLKKTGNEIAEIWSDPNSSVFSKIWDTVKTALIGLKEAVLKTLGGMFSALGDRIFGFFGENAQAWWENFKEKISETFSYIFDTIKNFFSWENIKSQWEQFKADPKEWVAHAWDGIKTFFNNIFSKIGQAFSGNEEFDFSEWVSDIINTVKNFFVNLFDKIKTTVTGWLEKINPANWISDAWDTVTDYAKNASWLPWNWGKNKTEVNDAIISKDNDLYIPSDDDNILVTKSEIVPQSSAQMSTAFQQELLSVLKDISSKLKQPTVINNVQASKAVDFGGLRL